MDDQVLIYLCIRSKTSGELLRRAVLRNGTLAEDEIDTKIEDLNNGSNDEYCERVNSENDLELAE